MLKSLCSTAEFVLLQDRWNLLQLEELYKQLHRKRHPWDVLHASMIPGRRGKTTHRVCFDVGAFGFGFGSVAFCIWRRAARAFFG